MRQDCVRKENLRQRLFSKDYHEAHLNEEAEPLQLKKREAPSSPQSILTSNYDEEPSTLVMPDAWILVKPRRTRKPVEKKKKRRVRTRAAKETELDEPVANDVELPRSSRLPTKFSSVERIRAKRSTRAVMRKHWARVRNAKAEARVALDELLAEWPDKDTRADETPSRKPAAYNAKRKDRKAEVRRRARLAASAAQCILAE